MFSFSRLTSSSSSSCKPAIRTIRRALFSRLYPTAPLPAIGLTLFRQHPRVAGDKTEVLLVQRKNEPKKGTWSLPGGCIELGETMLEAAHREVREECNLSKDDIILDRILTATDVLTKDKAGKLAYHFVLVHACGVAKPAAKPLAGDDAGEVRWFPIGRIETDAQPIFPEVVRVVKMAFKELSRPAE